MQWCFWPCELLGFLCFVFVMFLVLVVVPTEIITYRRLSAMPENADDHDMWNMEHHWNDGYRQTFFLILGIWLAVLSVVAVIWVWCSCRRKKRYVLREPAEH